MSIKVRSIMLKHSSSRLKYDLLLENSQEIILFFQKNGKVIDCNKAAKNILGYDDDIYEISISEIFRDAVRMQNSHIVINSKYKNVSNAAIAYKKNQTCITLELKIILIEDNKSFIGLCIATDITIKKKLISIIKYLKSEMKDLIDNKNDFVANITHELKTPVNGIMGMADILKDMDLDSEQKDNVNIIYQCCKNMNSLINDLLDIAKMKSNKLVLEERAFNFRSMIEDIVKINMKPINEKGLKLIVNVAKDIPKHLIGDEFRLAQIINNLFSNAIKFTNIGEIILDASITDLKHNEVELFLMIIDTGTGINLEEKDMLFASFYQADSSITRRFGGTGLGLSICKMLAKAMGGKIAVESEIGKGSTFSFAVKLKLPSEEINLDTQNSPVTNYNLREIVMEEETSISPEDNYMEILLGDAISSSDIEAESYENTDMTFPKSAPGSSRQNILLLMEKLIMTIELEGWKQAEQQALFVRDLISKEDKPITNKALQLLFAIRKEDRELSINRTKELERTLNEVI